MLFRSGSGRVPAGFNNIVGLKPTPGLVSNEGSVPACRSLDCISVFALSCADADALLKVMAEPHTTPAIGETFRFGMLGPKDAEFFGDEAYAALYAQAIGRLKAMGGTPVEIDYAPFHGAADLLYSGPWVAELDFSKTYETVDWSQARYDDYGFIALDVTPAPRGQRTKMTLRFINEQGPELDRVVFSWTAV